MSKDFIKVNGIVYRKVQDSKKVEDAPTSNERLESLAQGLGAEYQNKWRSYFHPLIVELDRQYDLMRKKAGDQISFFRSVRLRLEKEIGEVDFEGLGYQIKQFEKEWAEKLSEEIAKFVTKMKRQKATMQEIQKGLDEIVRIGVNNLKQELSGVEGKAKTMINEFEKKKKKFLK